MISPQLTVQCYGKSRAPCGMIRGSTASHRGLSYFTPNNSTSVYSYKQDTKEWDELPPYPYHDFSLVMLDGALTAVGGYYGDYGDTNKLLTLTLQQRQWVEKFPQMKTGRSNTAIVSTSDGEHVLVIGGRGGIGGRWTTTVELFSRRWYELTDLPEPLILPSATICGNHVHVIGYDGNGFSCSLQDLPSSDQLTVSQSRHHKISWSPLPPLPVTASTAANLSGQLVIFGGMRGIWSSVDSIHQLVDGQWVEIGSMSSCRRKCLVVSLSPDKMMIVGGRTGGLLSDSIEVCVVLCT